MGMRKNAESLRELFLELQAMPTETEWLEFKVDNTKPETIGEYISALSNSAALLGKDRAYMLWGVDDANHDVLGTSFNPASCKVGNEELENWLLHLLEPRINVQFQSLEIQERTVVLLEIEPASHRPVSFKGQEFVRVGSYKKRLREHPEKERDLWGIFDRSSFELGMAMLGLDGGEVLELLDYPLYFGMLKLSIPDGKKEILEALLNEKLIACDSGGKWKITNLGGILFSRDLEKFSGLKRKMVRVVQYHGRGRTKGIREKNITKGYAVGFEEMLDYIAALLPSGEFFDQGLRQTLSSFPSRLAIRELVANMLIHQDFSISGAGPMVEIFDDRIEMTNPGEPLVDVVRFVDTPPRSRNEGLASLMRRLRVCEERGSGIDKVVEEIERAQLPAPLFETPKGFTRATLFASRPLRSMDKADRVRACYLHACLKRMSNDYLTNASLRKRFGIVDKNKGTVSRYIREAVTEGMIKPFDTATSPRLMKYLPYWA